MQVSILIVDDSGFSRRMVGRALPHEWDVVVNEAVNGKMAIEAFETRQVDVMFLDLTMPEMDGFEVLRALRDKGIKTKIFIISADVQPEAQKVCRELGALDFLPKPLHEEYLRQVLKNHGLLP